MVPDRQGLHIYNQACMELEIGQISNITKGPTVCPQVEQGVFQKGPLIITCILKLQG